MSLPLAGSGHAVHGPRDGRYRYRAARRDGGLEFGVLDAASRADASAQLEARGLFPVEVRTQHAAAFASLGARDGGAPPKVRLSSGDLALGLRALATLLEAGLPMARALAAFDELAPPAWRPAMPAVRDSVREGRGLARALQDAPLAVPPLVIGMLHAGEAGSGLAAAVQRAAELMEHQAATRAALRSALTYPIILAFAGAASLALLVGVVLPRFAAILADLGQGLPPTTRFVLDAAALLRASAVPLTVVAVAGFVLWRAWTGSEDGRRAWHGWLLQLPLIGAVRGSAATARAAAAMASLLESGVPLSQAMLHAARATGDGAIAARLADAREAIVAGAGIAHALRAAEALTPTAVRLAAAGEESGRLAAMLGHAGRVERARAEELVTRAVRFVEPAIILAFGGVVAFVAAALLQAVYAVRPTG